MGCFLKMDNNGKTIIVNKIEHTELKISDFFTSIKQQEDLSCEEKH